MIPRWWREDPYKVKFATFNARAEDIRTKPTYRTPWKFGQRCLIPATWFYEFETLEVDGEKKPRKIPYRVQIGREEIMGLAGLSEIWKDVEGYPIESVTIITCESVEPLNTIHKRQPVIVERKNWETWLNQETELEKAYSLLRPRTDLEVLKIDERFNKAHGSELKEELVEPIE